MQQGRLPDRTEILLKLGCSVPEKQVVSFVNTSKSQLWNTVHFLLMLSLKLLCIELRRMNSYRQLFGECFSRSRLGHLVDP